VLNRFMGKVSPCPNTGCWFWDGASAGEYGYIRDERKRGVTAHRASYRLFCGEIPGGRQVLHSCDVPACVNPDHLFVGTQRDNIHDMKAKGRHPKGMAHGKSVLSPDLVLLIRQSPLSHAALGRELGVGKSTIFNVRSGRTWSHV
jgi:hypothetical protein